MEYRQLGRTGVRVSPLCLGTMLYGQSVAEAESIDMIDRAISSGINFIDMANVYGGGETEKIVGAALRKLGCRERIVVATKVYWKTGEDDPNAGGNSRRHIIAECERSLQRLQTDYIDLYQLHRADRHVAIDETLRALDDLIRDGKVRYIGTSTFPSWQIVESLWAAKELGLNRFVCEQPVYNLLDRTVEREHLPMALTFGLGIIPWSPLAGGLLTGKYTREGGPGEGRWSAGSDFTGRKMIPAAFEVIEVLCQLADEKGCTPGQLALSWCARQPGVTAPIIGARTMEQLSDNLGALEVDISDEDCRRLDEVAPPQGVTVPFYDTTRGVDGGPRAHRF